MQHEKVETIAIVGLGTIGSSWTAYFLTQGFTVRAFDPDPAAEMRTRTYVADAWTALASAGLLDPNADPARLSVEATLADAVRGAQFVQENGPEVERSKIRLLAEIDGIAPQSVPIASSSSAFMMSGLQSQCRYPERCFIGHPFNPPHLIPLVEIAGGERTAPDILDWAESFYRRIGRRPVRLQREVYGHIANRLQYVLYNEAAKLVLEGVATVEDVDAAVSEGPGLRWALFGPFMTLHLGGGPGGMAGSFEKFAGRDAASTDRAARITLAPEQQRLLIEGVEAAAAGRSVADLERRRDRALLELLGVKSRFAQDG